MDATRLLQYITTAKLGEGKWKGTTQNFVLHWNERIKEHERLVPNPTDYFSNGQKLSMLQNAVHAIPELSLVKNQVELSEIQTGQPVSYDTYLNLLKAQCTILRCSSFVASWYWCCTSRFSTET